MIVEGVRGTNYQGDIAIDDIIFSSSKCGVLPSNALPSLSTTVTTPLTAPTTSAPVTQAGMLCSVKWMHNFGSKPKTYTCLCN